VAVVCDAAEKPLDTIERKSLLYKSGLGFQCINHVLGCSHGCRYPCYAFLMARHHGRVSDYAQWCRPRIVGNALALLNRELAGKRVLPPEVHLCLTTDPFMVGQPEVGEMSLAIIERLNRSGIPCSLLTKGRLPAELADRRRFPCDNTHGISLVSLDEGFRREWEPGAAPYAERIAALRQLHDAGRRTLVHIEPYPTQSITVQDLPEILAEVGFVNHIYFSGWNYNPRVPRDRAAEAFYHQQRSTVRSFCARHGIECKVG
jgi:DNA repair photolyase